MFASVSLSPCTVLLFVRGLCKQNAHLFRLNHLTVSRGLERRWALYLFADCVDVFRNRGLEISSAWFLSSIVAEAQAATPL